MNANIDRLIAGMDLRRKIGQMFFFGFEGTEPSENVVRLIRERHLGGVIYFARNVASTAQVAKLSADLQREAGESGNLPLWISIDQEGGMVARITEGVALMPGNMAIAAGGSADAAFDAARMTGQELRALGINLNFAPVLDVNNNALNPVIGVRSYGESPEKVAEYGAAAIRGYQAAGVTATAKHFPGHGDTDVDSHLDLPTVPHDRERMDAVELVPFRRAIAEGVDAVMSSHIYFPALEPRKLPVTLSRAVLTGLLREELGFQGIVMTDCMEMKAIAEHYGTLDAAVMAVEAGADLVMVSHTYELQVRAMDAVYEAVRSGRIAEDRIDASVRRVLACKAGRGILAVGNAQPDSAGGRYPFGSVGSAEHREKAREISEASITLVRDDQGLLPLRRERTLVLTIAATVTSGADDSLVQRGSLGEALKEAGLDVVDRCMGPGTVASRLQSVLEEAGSDEIRQIVVGTYNAQFNPAQLDAVERLRQLGKPLVVVALRNPYDLLKLPEIRTFVAAYESRPLALQSAAKAVMGLIPFRGRLPVSLGDAYPAGWGVTGS